MPTSYSIAQLQAALQKAQAAGDAAAVADLSKRLETAQVAEYSRGYYKAQAAGDEPAMHDLLSRITRSGHHLLPMDSAQIADLDKRTAAQTADSYDSGEQAWLGVGQSFVNTARGLNDLAHLRASADPSAADTALDHTWGGAIGNVIGSGVQMGIPAGDAAKGLSWAGKAAPYVEQAARGVAFSAAQPAKDLADRGLHAAEAAGAAILGTGAGQLVSKLAGSAGNALRLLSRSGRAKLALSRLMKVAASTGEPVEQVARRMLSATRYVPGEVPTAEQAAPSAEMLQLEKALRQRAKTQLPFVHMAEKNDAANLTDLRHLAGLDSAGEDTGAMAAAQKVRAENFAQMSGELARTLVDPSELIDHLDTVLSEFGAYPAVETVVKSAQQNIRDQQARNLAALLRDGMDKSDALQQSRLVNGRYLQLARSSLKSKLADALNTRRPDGIEVRGVQQAAKGYTDLLDKQVPGYAKANAQYAKDSRVINDMQGARDALAEVEHHGTNTAGKPYVSKADIEHALKRDDREEFGLSPAARKRVENIHMAIKRREASLNKVSALGDDPSHGEKLLSVLASPWVQRFIGVETAAGLAGTAEGQRHGHPLIGGLAGMAAGIPITAGLGAAQDDVLAREAMFAANADHAAGAITAASKAANRPLAKAARESLKQLADQHLAAKAAVGAVNQANNGQP